MFGFYKRGQGIDLFLGMGRIYIGQMEMHRMGVNEDLEYDSSARISFAGK
jgi:hypothetical protein